MTKTLNPWFSIWIKPRQTIRQVQQTYSITQIVWLWVLAQSIQFMFRWFDRAPEFLEKCSIHYTLKTLWLYGFAMTPIIMGITVIMSWLVLKSIVTIAHKLGSSAQLQDLVYVGWINIAGILLYIPFLILSLLLGKSTIPEDQQILIVVVPAFILGLWLMVVWFLCTSEALKLSKKRTLACIIVNFVIWMVLILIIVALATIFNKLYLFF